MVTPLATGILLLWQAALGSFESNSSKGQAYLKQGNVTAALPYLEVAHRLSPSHAATRYDLALAYIETRQYHRARDFLRGLLEGGESADLRNLLGVAEDRAGDFKAAAVELEKAARLDPSERNLFDLGNHLVNYNGFGEAAKVFGFAIERYPKSARLHVGLGVALYSMSKYDEAVETLCRAVDLDPADPRAMQFLGKMQSASPAMAKEVSRRLAGFVTRFPHNASAHYYYAVSLRELGGDAARVESHLKRVVALDPHFLDAFMQLGSLYEAAGNDEAAKSAYLEALKLNTEQDAAHYRLAHIYRRAGRMDLAVPHLDAGVSIRRRKEK